jgi:hypothetical protein
MKIKLLIIALVPLLLLGCDDLFSDGDVFKTFDGTPQVEFARLNMGEVSEIAGSREFTVQLIGEQRSEPLTVFIGIDESSTAVEGTHYNLLNDEVTIAPGTSAATGVIEILDSGANASVTLRLNIESTSDAAVEPAANLKQTSMVIQRFNRLVTLQPQALDLRENDSSLLVSGVTGQAGDLVVVTTYVANGNFAGATIVGFTELQANLRNESVVVDVDGADPADHTAHVIRGFQVSQQTLDSGVVSAETAGFIAANSSAPVYAVAQFEWNNETFAVATNQITVDVIEILYVGTLGVEFISIDLHAVDEDGVIGAFVGISQEDLPFNQLHNNVVVDVVEPVDPAAAAPERVDSTISVSGTFFAMAHLGAAGLDGNGNRIPAQKPALRAALDQNGNGFAFIPIGDLADVEILL